MQVYVFFQQSTDNEKNSSINLKTQYNSLIFNLAYVFALQTHADMSLKIVNSC